MAEQANQGVFDRFKQFIEADRQKWGGRSLGAHGRLGLSELREAFSPGGNITQSTPYGMWGTPTPGEVAPPRDNGSGSASIEASQEAAYDRGPAGQAGGSVHGPELTAGETLPSPSQIAGRHKAEPGHSVHGPERSPSDIARAPKPQEQQQEHDRDRDHGQEMGRGR